MPSLHVLYVVRNEQDIIAKSLLSVQPIADRIVVVDTGSHDQTIRACRQVRGVRMFRHDWVHDFSKTKNYGLGHCDSDWVLCVDADETLDARSASEIRRAITTAPPHVLGYALHIVDHERTWEPSAESNPRPFFRSPQVRLFRRLPGIVFEGKVMESPRESILRRDGAIDVLDAKLHHFLWHGMGEEYAAKRISYYNMLGASLDAGTASMLGKSRTEKPPAEDPPPKDLVAIVVVAFDGLSLTKACLESISQNTSHPYSLYLVDNGSRDGTRSFMGQFLGGTPLWFDSNQGVAKARNAGARRALRDPAVEHVCFLDNDTRVKPGWLSAMVKSLDETPGTGIVGPLSGPIGSLDGPANEAMTAVPEVEGFCLLARADLLRKTGLFDESFGLYGHEASDLCRRARAAGHKIIICGPALVEHEGRGTLRRHRHINWHDIMKGAALRYADKWRDGQRKTMHPSPTGQRGILLVPRGSFSHPRTSIIVICHNRIDMTRSCLQSILRNTSNFELVVVDNGSTDGTAEYLGGMESVTVIRNEKNMGVPKARNQGIRSSTCKYILIIDNDIDVFPGWLDEIFAEINKGADIVGTEAWQINSQLCAYRQCIPGEKPARFDYLGGGSCCLFRREVFEKVGLLDEGFSPAYYEDCDACVRAKKAGFKLAWVPTDKAIHKPHSTLIHGQKDFNYQDALVKSQARFAAKVRGEIKVKHEILPRLSIKPRILYLGMQYDYGARERGESFEHANFYPALREWSSELVHFDFVDLGIRHGLPRMSKMLYDAVQKHCPDALFCVFFDDRHDPRREVLGKISQTTPAKVIGWFCDSHWRYESFDRKWAPYMDFCVTTSQVAYERYRADGLGDKAIKSQWAASPKYERIEGVRRDVDVSFVGQPHGDRRAVIDQVRRAGIDVQAYGAGWSKRLSFDEMVLMFNRSRINLNLANSCDAKFKQIKGRNFEVPACGGFLLTGEAENLGDYYKQDEEMATFASTAEMIEKIRHYLSHENEREAMAEAAHRRTMLEHTYAHRFDHIFGRTGLI